MPSAFHSLAAAVLLSFALTAGCAADTTDGVTEDGTIASDQSTNANEKAAFEFFVARGLTEIQSAAIVGNLQQESNVNPSAVQTDGLGRGIAQWSMGARWNVAHEENLAWYAAKEGGSPHSLHTQLAFIWYELEIFPVYGLESPRAANTLPAACYVFQKDFEACGACNASHRVGYAKAVFNAYGHGG